MKWKRKLPAALSVLILTAAVILISLIQKAPSEPAMTDKAPKSDKPQMTEEMRGVWVTYMALDVENESDKEAAFDAKIDDIIKQMKKGGFNTMVVQVRPFCDAIYPSEYFPWSHIISGEQGVGPGFDPLAHIVKKCRDNNLYIHAWINPYRVSTEKTPAQLSDNNPCVKDDTLGAEINGRLYLNPASEKARKLIADGVREIVENYDVDGIQFDDYFYPEDCGDFDAAEYESFLKTADKPLTLDGFRKQNVSEMVKQAYKAAHDANNAILFGISPQGNLGNNDGLYADVITWCAEDGYIDYICPQIYFSLDNPALTFEDSLNEWLSLKKHKGLRLYIGLAGYKAGTDADEGTWLDNDDILLSEVKTIRQSKADGFMLYSSDSFYSEENSAEMQNLTDYLTTSATQ